MNQETCQNSLAYNLIINSRLSIPFPSVSIHPLGNGRVVSGGLDVFEGEEVA